MSHQQPPARMIQVGDIMRASRPSPLGPRSEKEVTVAWVSENGHRIRTTDGEAYQVPDLIATGRSVSPPAGVDSESWTCRGCGGQMIGRRPADDTCAECTVLQVTTEPPQADPQRAAYIAGLRQLADVLDAHPEIPLPYDGNSDEITFHFLSGEDPRAEMAAAARALPCTWRKDADGDYFDLLGELSGLKVRLVAYREVVCTRRVVGTEEREVEEEVRPAEIRKIRKQVEVVEWDCHPILAAGDSR